MDNNENVIETPEIMPPLFVCLAILGLINGFVYRDWSLSTIGLSVRPK